MTKLLLLVLFLIILLVTPVLTAGCVSNPTSPSTSTGTPSPTSASGLTLEDEAAIYAAVLRQLATVDDTFGGNLKPARLFVIRNTDDQSGDPSGQGTLSILIPQPVQEKITELLQDLPSTVIWIDKFEDAEFDNKETSLVKDGAIYTLGNIQKQNKSTVHLSGSIYIANLAAGGTTYVLEKKDEAWVITGTTGPHWIS